MVGSWLLQVVPASDLYSLPESYYSDDETFQVLKFNLIRNLEIGEVVESITLYLKKVQSLTQKLEGLPMCLDPTCGLYNRRLRRRYEPQV